MAEVRSEKTRVPKLRVSDKTKRANDFEHTKRVMDHYIASSTFVEELINPAIRDIRIFYAAYNNHLPDDYFRYVTNPLNSSNSDYTNWPARLRPYSIIRPNIDLIEGEYQRRPFSFAVKVHNSDAVNSRLDAEYNEVLASLEQQFINSLNARGVDTGMESQEPEMPESIKQKYSSNYRDQRAIMGENALNAIIDEQMMVEKCKALFHDWMVVGETYTYKGIRGGRMVYERVSPLDIDYDKSPDTPYVEDAQWAVRRMYLTPAEINDYFYQELEENQIDVIEDENGHLSFRGITTNGYNVLRNDQDLKRSKVVVYHVVFKYMVKVGILTFNDEMGQPQSIEVPEDYKPSEGESVEWYWVNEVWEGYKIADEFYLGIKPIPAQRNVANNMSACKLPYNGRRFSDVHSNNISPVEMGMAYETLHRILHFNLEKTIAKSKGKIALIDYNAIPKKYGWDEEKFFYWSEANGWALMDRNQPGADKSFNQYTVLDLGLYQHISSIIEVMEYVKSEWDDLLGITRQRKGDSKASDTAAANQMAISQSATISESVFTKFEDFVRCELQGLLDLSKLAWAEGHQLLYQGDDMRTSILSIDPTTYTEAEYGVYISRSARDLQDLEIARQQVQAFAQNGVAPSTIIDVLQAKSLSRLRNVLEQAEGKAMAAAGQQQQSEQEAAERLEMIKGQFEELKGYLKERQINLQYDREEDLELLRQTGVDQNPDPIDPSNAQKVMLDDQNKKREIALKERSEAVKAAQKSRELDLKQHELVVRERIADKANATAIKNKVVGERNKAKNKSK